MIVLSAPDSTLAAGNSGGSLHLLPQLLLRAGVPPAAEPGAVTRHSPAHHLGRDVPILEVADRDAAIIGLLAVKLAPEFPTQDHLAQLASGGLGAGFSALGCSEALKPYRDRADLDGVAVADVDDLLEHGDIVGRDAAGRNIVQLAVDDWTLEKLMAFDADAADLEDGGDAEPDADDEEDGPPVLLEVVRPKVMRVRR